MEQKKKQQSKKHLLGGFAFDAPQIGQEFLVFLVEALGTRPVALAGRRLALLGRRRFSLQLPLAIALEPKTIATVQWWSSAGRRSRCRHRRAMAIPCQTVREDIYLIKKNDEIQRNTVAPSSCFWRYSIYKNNTPSFFEIGKWSNSVKNALQVNFFPWKCRKCSPIDQNSVKPGKTCSHVILIRASLLLNVSFFKWNEKGRKRKISHFFLTIRPRRIFKKF